MPLMVIELSESWQGTFGRHRNINFWRLVPHCLMWCIWGERNARCFEGCKQSLLEIKSLMREMQENYYLVLFMFASQLYFYVLGPISLLGY